MVDFLSKRGGSAQTEELLETSEGFERDVCYMSCAPRLFSKDQVRREIIVNQDICSSAAPVSLDSRIVVLFVLLAPSQFHKRTEMK